MKRVLLFAMLFVITASLSFAQQTTTEIPPSKQYRFNPSIGAGAGILKYFGDVEDGAKTSIHRIGNRFGYNFNVSGNFTNSLYLDLDFMKAKLSGNENGVLWHRNFESDVFAVGLNLIYNFRDFYKRDRSLKPFFSIGFSYTDYEVKADLYNERSGSYYYYWDDGLIRNSPEGTPESEELKYVDRDYKYETSLREKPVVSFAIPAALGISLEVSKAISFRLSAKYFYTFTDLIDNFDNPEFSKYNDRFLYTSASVQWHFLPAKKDKTAKKEKEYYFADFESLEKEDEDGDGVKDFIDKCLQTPKSVKVDEFGCPLDTDRDGIPDYLDKEPKTASGRVVDPQGVALNYQKIAENSEAADTIGMLRRAITESYVNSQPRQGYKYTVHVGTFGKEIPTPLHKKLKSLPGLVETKVNDTLTVYTLGSYESFEAAEKKQNELIYDGIDESFAVPDDVVNAAASDAHDVKKSLNLTQGKVRSTTNIQTKEKEHQVLFKVQLTEYRMRIELEKLSQVMAEYGTELRTSQGGLKIFTIGNFENFEEAEALRKRIMELGIKDAEIVASYNNEAVSVEKARELQGK